MNNNTLAIYITFVAIGLAIWIDSLWIKVPVTIMIVFTAFAMSQEQSDGTA